MQTLLTEAAGGIRAIHLSLIQLGEVLYIVERERGLVGAQKARAAIDQLPIEIMPVSRASVLAAAHIKAQFPLSYADAFAVTTAQDHNAILLAGDPEFKAVEDAGLVTVEWLPRA